jgi:hypothetical protein
MRAGFELPRLLLQNAYIACSKESTRSNATAEENTTNSLSLTLISLRVVPQHMIALTHP